MYADDTVVYTAINQRSSSLEIHNYQEDLQKITQWCHAHKLFINTKKTKLMMLGGRSKLRSEGLLPELKMNDETLSYTDSYRYLGLMLNCQLTLAQHVNSTIGLVSSKLKTFAAIRKYINVEHSLLVYKSMILSLFEYANISFTLVPLVLRKKLERLQNRALRIIYFFDVSLPVAELRVKAKLIPLAQRADTQLLCLM